MTTVPQGPTSPAAAPVRTIGDLPFVERPALELLHLAEHRAAPDRDYAGYGWARVPRLWLASPGGAPRVIDDALVLALHSADDAEPLADDVELYFELPDAPPVTVLASRFLARWLPRLPPAPGALVLALCNPHGATLARPPGVTAPILYATGDVESWLVDDPTAGAPRIELVAPTWRNIPS